MPCHWPQVYDVSSGYRKRPLVWNGLKRTIVYTQKGSNKFREAVIKVVILLSVWRTFWFLESYLTVPWLERNLFETKSYGRK